MICNYIILHKNFYNTQIMSDTITHKHFDKHTTNPYKPPTIYKHSHSEVRIQFNIDVSHKLK